MTKDIEREALISEIELFIAKAMKAYVVERWADSYQNTKPFAYTIDAKNEVWWMKTQAHQLWKFWQAAKAHEAEKLKGCVVVPVEPTEAMMINALAVIATDVGTKCIDFEIRKIWEKMVEAARGRNDNGFNRM